VRGKKIVGWLSRDGIAAGGCSSMGAGSIGGKNYCGNLLWQSSLTLLPLAAAIKLSAYSASLRLCVKNKEG